jgi:NTP pyrophosphatase (non-canonical NTP hydrolase)
MKKSEQTQIMKAAITNFGFDNQMDMAVEECAELIQAINKFKRKRQKTHTETDMYSVFQNLYEEIADVEIMVAQLRLIFCNNSVIDKIKIQKLERLKKEIDG